MIRISKDHKYYKQGAKVEPAARINTPETIIFETNDCYDGDMVRGMNQHISDIDFSRGNPTTGPVYIEGAEPGDVLEIYIRRVDMISPGLSFCGVNEGFLQEDSKVEELRWYNFDENGVDFGNGLILPYRPMIGEIGVAPKNGSLRNVYPGDHGGNLDTSLIKAGATLFLPVFQPGAMLGCGDLHAAMGDGEAFYEGIECAGEVELDVVVRKDLKMDIPFVISDGKFASIATDKTIELALRKAMKKLIAFICNYSHGLSETDVNYIVGFYGNLEISQVVDPEMTGRMSIELDILKKLGIDPDKMLQTIKKRL